MHVKQVEKVKEHFFEVENTKNMQTNAFEMMPNWSLLFFVLKAAKSIQMSSD